MMALIPEVLAACLAVSAASDHVRAGDLATAEEAFAALDPNTVISLAPAPGVKRVFSVAELRRIATRLGTPSAPRGDLCVERKTARLDPAHILAAIQSQAPHAELKLLDFSRTPAPEGELEFPRNGLRRAPGGAYFWNGAVRYAGGRRFCVWVKIAARAPAPVVVAAADLRPGHAIETAEVRLETRDTLFTPGVTNTLDRVIGKWPRRLVRAGTPIEPQWLEPAPEIARGDAVKVEVWSGSARLELDARAESAAAAGQPVAILNPLTRKRFLARVVGKGRVSVGQKQEKP